MEPTVFGTRYGARPFIECEQNKRKRMVMKTTGVAALLMLCVISGTVMSVLGAHHSVIVVVDNAYPPYMFGTTKQARGLYPSLIHAIFTRIGRDVEVRAYPWKKALAMGEEKNVAVGGIYKNDARMSLYDYSDPLFVERLMVYVKTGKRFPFTQFSDLQGKIIGLNRGWSYGEEFDAARGNYHLTVAEGNSNVENFRKLVAGRIDCLIADQVAASQIIQQQQLEEQVEQLNHAAAANAAYIVFAKPLKQQSVLEQFNRALAEMKRDGSYGKIIHDFLIHPLE
jgi:polar amino acid transport system substrate-binding protein